MDNPNRFQIDNFDAKDFVSTMMGLTQMPISLTGDTDTEFIADTLNVIVERGIVSELALLKHCLLVILDNITDEMLRTRLSGLGFFIIDLDDLDSGPES